MEFEAACVLAKNKRMWELAERDELIAAIREDKVLEDFMFESSL